VSINLCLSKRQIFPDDLHSDVVYLRVNPLSDRSMDVYIPQLEERGVKIDWTCPP
jgi:hypothetical protein